MDLLRNDDLETRLAAVEATLEALRRRVAKALVHNGAGAALAGAGEVPTPEATSSNSTQLQARIEELECRSRAIAENQHTILAAQSARLQELFELLDRCQADLRVLTSEMEGFKQRHEEIASQMPILRQAFRAVDLRLRKLEGPRPPRANAAARPGQAQVHVPPAVSAPAPATPAAPAATGNAAAAESHAAASQSGSSPGTAFASTGESLRLLHIEEDPDLQQAVADFARKWSVHYDRPGELCPKAAPGRRLLVVNLLLPGFDALGEIANYTAWGIDEPVAFTYCAEGNRGAALGIIHFFPSPFDVQACASRLLARPSRPRRLLVVGEAFEIMNSLKECLAREQCGISMAFDARQALDLVPMLKPDFVLADLSMPNGEAMRLAVRLHVTHPDARLSLGFFWTQPIPPNDFRQQALRAIRDVPLSTEDIVRTLSHSFTPEGRDW